MKRITTLREEFDRDRNFETVKPFKLSGAVFGPGQSFNKTLVTTRRLRQLYDARYLKMMKAVVRSADEEHPRALVQIGNMVTTEQLDQAQFGEVLHERPRKKIPRVQLAK